MQACRRPPERETPDAILGDEFIPRACEQTSESPNLSHIAQPMISRSKSDAMPLVIAISYSPRKRSGSIPQGQVRRHSPSRSKHQAAGGDTESLNFQLLYSGRGIAPIFRAEPGFRKVRSFSHRSPRPRRTTAPHGVLSCVRADAYVSSNTQFSPTCVTKYAERLACVRHGLTGQH